jgi:hypothetical protein
VAALLDHQDSRKERCGALDPETVDLATRQDQGSSQQRLAIWQLRRPSSRSIRSLASALGAYPEAHFIMASRPEFDPNARGYRDTHSTYLNIMAETGVPGFLLFMGIIVLTLKNARAARKKYGKGCTRIRTAAFQHGSGLLRVPRAAIWGSYVKLVPLYMHLVLIHVATQLLIEHGEGFAAQQRGRRQFIHARCVQEDRAGCGGERIGVRYRGVRWMA